jgi:hypothetical protein
MYRLLENIAPFLLTVIIFVAIIYFFIKKITSPFSRLGNFAWEKYKQHYNNIAQKRKTKLENQLKNSKIEIADWRNKYLNKSKIIMEMKDQLSDLSKVFSEINEDEYTKNILTNDFDKNKIQIKNIEGIMSKGFFEKIKVQLKMNKIISKE